MTWLERLKKTAESPKDHPTKPTKPGFGGFVGTPLGLIQKSLSDPAPANDERHATTTDREAIEERAAIMEYDGGLSRIEAEALAGITPDPDRHCWPHTTAMNTAEIDTFTARVLLFTRHGRDTTEAEKLADKLVARDRDGDDRRVCLECRNLRRSGGLWRCGQPHRAGWAGADLPGDLVNLLQRCDGFTS